MNLRPRPLHLRPLLAHVSLGFVLAFAGIVHGSDTAKMSERIKAHAANDKFMGSVLVAKGGTVVFEQSSGWANAEWKIPNTAATKFRIGSVTKQFTAAAILLLAEQGKLQLDDPLSKFVPEAPETWRPVTLRQLLSHTGGVPSFTSDKRYLTWKLSPTTPAQQMAHLADKPLEFTPGEKYNYSNTGYLLLGWIVELASGKSYEAYLREQIFQPLGMSDTGVDSNTTIIPQRAAGYDHSGSSLKNGTYIDMHVPGGAGAMYSTTHDLLRWNLALFGGQVLKPALLALMTTPVKNNYALGIGVAERNGRKIISHSGGIDGFNAYLTYFPDSQLTVVVLANVTGSPYPQIARELAALALGEPLPTSSPTADSGKKGGYRLAFRDHTLERVAAIWKDIYQTKVSVAERARAKTVYFDIAAPTRDELRQRLTAALLERGVHVIERDGEVRFELEPDHASRR